MEKDVALKLLVSGRADEWNSYREQHPEWNPDLSDSVLAHVFLHKFNLRGANLCGTLLPREKIYYELGLHKVDMQGAFYDIATCFGEHYPIEEDEDDYDFEEDEEDYEPVVDNISLIKYGARIMLESEQTRKHKVFISYAWVDENIVLAIDYWLHLKNIQTKIDRRDFFSGSRIQNEIIRVMQECNVILIFYSHAAEEKAWTEFERELASDLEIDAKKKGKIPPKIIYIVIDDTPLPTVSVQNKLAIFAKGKPFELVCEEIYYGILQIPRRSGDIDLDDWKDFVF